jgi:hypothetical protein
MKFIIDVDVAGLEAINETTYTTVVVLNDIVDALDNHGLEGYYTVTPAAELQNYRPGDVKYDGSIQK